MLRYLAVRALLNIPVLGVVVTLVFFATSVLPGDFAAERLARQEGGDSSKAAYEARLARYRAELDLDHPIVQRYGIYMTNIMRGSFGHSFENGEPVTRRLTQALPYTVQLAVSVLLVAICTSIPLGVTAAVWKNTWIDHVVRVFTSLTISIPPFWLATMVLLYVVRWHLWSIPISSQPLIWESFGGSLRLLAIPALVGGLAAGAPIMRLMRSELIDVLNQDYIRSARAKGLSGSSVVFHHALKNALIPVMTITGVTVSGVLGGSVVLESLFNMPGIGSNIVNAINSRDVPVVQMFVLFIAAAVVSVNLVVDALYSAVDPRVTLR